MSKQDGEYKRVFDIALSHAGEMTHDDLLVAYALLFMEAYNLKKIEKLQKEGLSWRDAHIDRMTMLGNQAHDRFDTVQNELIDTRHPSSTPTPASP